MSKVLPFPGWRYNTEKIDIEDVVAPPYDVVSQKEVEFYKNKSPYNIFHLELPESYEKAKELLNKWIDEKILIKEKEPCFYYYEVEFTYQGKKLKRRGFVGLVELVPFEEEKVLPHEKVYPKITEDRFNLLKTTGFQFSQIFGLFEDPGLNLLNNLDKEELLYQVSLNEEIHRLYKIPPEVYKLVKNHFIEKKIYIADGHHRYTTALKYKKYMESINGKNPLKDYNYIAMYLTAFEEESLLMLPTHRLYKLKDPKELINSFSSVCEIKSIDWLELFSENLFTHPEREWLFFAGKEAFLVGIKPALWGRLEQEEPVLSKVTLHNFLKVWEEITGLKEEELKEKGKVLFFSQMEDVMEKSEKEGLGVVFPVLSPLVLKKVASAGKRMPHKCTYFYPKVLTGFLLKEARGNLLKS